MKDSDRERWIVELVKAHRQFAALGTFEGRHVTPYYDSCRVQNMLRGVTTILTRDVGYHSSGWWKNPDYERCLHLSISFFDPMTLQLRDDARTERDIVRAMFFPHAKLVWVESAKYPEGRRRSVIQRGSPSSRAVRCMARS